MVNAVILMGIGIFFFSLMNVGVKMLEGIPLFQIVFFRSLFAGAIAFATLKALKINPWGNNKKLLLLRGLFGFTALSLFFLTVKHLPLASALTIQYLSPIFVAIFAIILLREPMAPLQWLWFALGFLGVMLIKGFDDRVSWLYLGIGVTSAVFSGLAYNVVRMLKDHDSPLVVVFYFPLVAGLFSGIISIFGWVQPEGMQWFWLLFTGACAHLGQIFMTRSLHLEKANIVGSMKYLGIVWALIYGYFLFGEVYPWTSLLGMGLVFTGVFFNLYIAWKKSKSEA